MKRDNNRDIELGRFISLILRHNPSSVNIKLDGNGYAKVSELIAGINKSGKHIDVETLNRIVKENNKQRFSFNEDKTKIRANQGHSIKIDLNLKKEIPPKILYHGTATRFLESIKKEGLVKKSRQYVHLSKDRETAISVGRRHGKPIVLLIDTEKMVKDGYSFYISENGVWLSENISYKYIKIDI